MPKIFYNFIINFLEKNISVFLHNFNIFQIKYTLIDNKRNRPVNVTYGAIFISGLWLLLLLLLPTEIKTSSLDSVDQQFDE